MSPKLKWKFDMKFLLTIISASFLSLSPALAAETYVKADHVTAKKVNSKGHILNVPGVGKVKITHVTAKPSMGDRRCHLHLPSVAKLVADQLAASPEKAGVVIKVKLKFVVYGEDDWGCKGAGEDCVADVEIPSKLEGS